MKILEITGEPIGSGGQEMFIINVLTHIDLNDLTIDLLTPYYCENEHYKNIVEQKGGKVTCLGIPFQPGNSRWNIVNPINEYLKNNDYDAVHIHSGSISVLMLCSMIARWNNIKKIIVHSHCTGYIKNWKYYVLKMLSYPILRFIPTHYCACSVEAGEWKFPQYIVKNKLQVIKNGIDLIKFRSNTEARIKYRDKYGISDNELLIGHVGRFCYMKNQEFLMRILRSIRDRGIAAKLMLVGGGEDERMLRNLAVQLKIESYVIFTGVVNNVSDFMQAMDVFAFSSRWEGLGLVAIEAQAVGLSVIASDAVPRLAKVSDNIKFISLKNVDDWIDAIIKLSKLRLKDITESIRSQGFDINETATVIRKIYFE
ncbi:glycosyltransferase [Phocaeicola plebeius]|uniref:glycosyltransferase n=1 Tax=Phocaeicola plebeius TaxID=310297 RepID=UPI0026EE4008|nr:glycosyltransferase [Phocaeicola plebeius]